MRNAREYTKMKPKIKKLWLKALRTPPDKGGYVQLNSGRMWHEGRYGNPDSFCCLGVLGNLANLSGDFEDHDQLALKGGYGNKDTHRWAGLDPAAVQNLACLNDSGKTFPEIADWIEARL